jgi:DNA uptake protein ComE-like DNA-binding protein
LPVDLAAVKRDVDDVNWASNTTLDNGSDFYIANRGNNTIVRMRQDGTVVAVRRVAVDAHGPWDNASLNGIATSTDGTTIYVTYTGPGQSPGGVLALPKF